jgi:hypothetical protein
MDTTDNPPGTGSVDESTPKKPPSGRDARGRFRAGAPSANPKGRPTESHEMKALARDKTAEAIKRLTFWLRSDDPAASVAAAKELLSRGYGRPEQAVVLDATIAAANRRADQVTITPSDPIEASRLYLEIIHGKRSLDSVTFASAAEKDEVVARAYEQIMDPHVPAPAEPALAALPRPKALAESTEMVQAPTSAAPPAAGPSERPSAAPAPSPVAVDPQDPSVVLVVEEPLRHFHEHRPKADSTCPRCRQMWVNS